MKKNANKIVAFAIGISVMSGSIIPVFAADSTQTTTSEVKQVTNSAANTALNISSAANAQNQVKKTTVLTLKEAIDAAINNSDKLALKAKEIRLYEDKADIQEELDDLQGSDDDFPYDKLELTIKQTKEQKEYTEDQIAEDITNKYNNIVLMQNTLNKLKKQIEIQTRDNENAKFKKSLGMLISLDISKAEIEIQKLKNSEKDQQNKFKNAQDYFKIITEKDVNNYVLEQDQEYKEFRIEGSLDEYFDNVVEKYYKYDNKLFEMTKDNLKDNDVDRPNSNDKPNKDDSRFQKDITDADGNITGKAFDSKAYDAAEQTYVGLWNDFGNYLQNKYNLSSSKVSLDEKKKNLKKGLEESYASLASMENDINVAKSNIDVKNKELSIAKLKYDEGLIMKINYDKQILDYEDLETNLRSSINSYNKLKNQIQKPWLLSSSAS